MNKKWFILTLCMVALVSIAAGSYLVIRAADNPPADQVGPYKVGFVAHTYYDSARSDFAGGSRPILTFIWYPAAPGNGTDQMPPAVYSMTVNGLPDLPDVSSTDFEPYGIDPAYQEVAASKDGPFPLLIFSPGLGADSLGYVDIGTRLASHGFVVAVPTNFDDKRNPMGLPEFYPTVEAYMLGTYLERTRDILYLLTQLVAESQQSGNLLSGTIRSDQVAVGGHSLGALATLALAGGDDSACDWSLVGDPNNIPPETCIPVLPDPRIKAIIPIDGPSYDLKYEEMARIEIPTMLIGQEYDALESQMAGLGTMLARPHSAIQGYPNYRLDIAHATHMSLSSFCSYVHVLYDKGYIDAQVRDIALPSNCPLDSISPVEVQTSITRNMIAFLKTVLVGETGYKQMLTTDYASANEPLVEFFETEQDGSNTPVEDGYFSFLKHQPAAGQSTALKDP